LVKHGKPRVYNFKEKWSFGMKRVVVTGMGIYCPVGNSVKECWDNLTSGKSGISKVSLFDIGDEPIQIAGEVKNFNPAEYMSPNEARRSQRFVQLAVNASKQALLDANFPNEETSLLNLGVSIGVGVGGMRYMEEQIVTLSTKGSARVSPFCIPGFIANMAAGMVSIECKALGPNICPTTACTSGTHGIGEALLYIQTGRATSMLAGGAESTISGLPFAGFGKMKALASGWNESPEKASRPFDANRNGFVMGEGAGVLLLEEYESAKARGARIYCELVGYGMSGDGFHMTSPSPGGEGAIRAMRQALQTGGLNPSDIGYINAHGTSTELNDATETQAIKSLFGDYAYKLNISSTKSMTGHLLGAAGGIEAVFSVKALVSGVIPPTINQEKPDPLCDLNYTPNSAQEKRFRAVISNSFGFGGTNACLAFKSI
jgi:3-oxoacyl-[acyl-carrier-protein] synthase II